LEEAVMSKYVKVLILCLAMAVLSCKPVRKQMTDTENKAAEKAIEALAEKLATAISQLDAEKVTSFFGKADGTLYVGDGVVVPRNKLRETFDSLYGDIQEMHVIFEKKRIRVLNPSAVSLTGWAHYAGTMKDGQKTDEHAIFTILYLRKRGKWSIFQAHKSLLLSYQGSETSKARPRLSQFCRGNGIDLGYGGDPIVPSAMTMDLPSPYTKLGGYPQNLAGDARDLYWFKDNVLDYVYSSHLLEDFSSDETATVLREWLRVIKVGGVLVLYGPDQQAYRAHCLEKGKVPNPGHKIDNFGLEYVKGILEQNFRGRYSMVHEIALIDDYSFDLVIKKLK
jgi:uncharacterized protein (TIGR02246 family)